MGNARSKSTEGDAVSFGDEGDATGSPVWVNNLKYTFPLHSGSLGARYILDVSELVHVLQLTCLSMYEQLWTISH
jgi:hypothetical protein